MGWFSIIKNLITPNTDTAANAAPPKNIKNLSESVVMQPMPGGLTNNTLSVDEEAVTIAIDKLIVPREGFIANVQVDRLARYPVWNIGHGLTYWQGKKVSSSWPGRTITVEESKQEIKDYINKSIMPLFLHFTSVCFTANQKAGFISFIYNEGLGGKDIKDGFIWLKSGKHSNVYNCLQAGDISKAADAILEWDVSGGIKLKGLTDRRKAERELILTA